MLFEVVVADLPEISILADQDSERTSSKVLEVGGDSVTERVGTGSTAACSSLLPAADRSPPSLAVQAFGKMGVVAIFPLEVEGLEAAVGSMAIP